MFCAICHRFQISKVFIPPQPFNQHLYNIYKFMYIYFLPISVINLSTVVYKSKYQCC